MSSSNDNRIICIADVPYHYLGILVDVVILYVPLPFSPLNVRNYDHHWSSIARPAYNLKTFDVFGRLCNSVFFVRFLALIPEVRLQRLLPRISDFLGVNFQDE